MKKQETFKGCTIVVTKGEHVILVDGPDGLWGEMDGDFFDDNTSDESAVALDKISKMEPGAYTCDVEYWFEQGFFEGHPHDGENEWDLRPVNVTPMRNKFDKLVDEALEKLTDYLPYCTEFYFVAPPDIIDPAEVPEQSGLMVATKNLKRLIVKKKAPARDVEIPQSILIYILMCRTRVVSDTGRPRADIWRDRLKEMKSNKLLGWELSHMIRERVDNQVGEVRAENRRLKDENGKLQVVKDLMDEIGISADDLGRGGRMMIERKFKEAMTGIPYDLPGFLSEIQAKAGQALEALKT